MSVDLIQLPDIKSHKIRVISATGLRLSPTIHSVTPYVLVSGESALPFPIGRTPHISSGSPVWNSKFRCPFFKCVFLSFTVAHHRMILLDVVLGTATVSIDSALLGEQMTVPIIMTFNCPELPLLKICIDRSKSPSFPRFSSQNLCTHLYAYLSYWPRLPDAYDAPPVTIRAIGVEWHGSVFDHTIMWAPFGGTTCEKTAIHETGRTPVIAFPVKVRFISTFLICSSDYSGEATMHFIATSRLQDYLWKSVTVSVQPNSVQSIPGYILVKRYRGIRLEPMPSLTFPRGGFFPEFEFDIARLMYPTVLMQRFIQPFDRPWSLPMLMVWHRIPQLHTIHTVFG
jgi:hypothetical protein